MIIGSVQTKKGQDIFLHVTKLFPNEFSVFAFHPFIYFIVLVLFPLMYLVKYLVGL